MIKIEPCDEIILSKKKLWLFALSFFGQTYHISYLLFTLLFGLQNKTKYYNDVIVYWYRVFHFNVKPDNTS